MSHDDAPRLSGYEAVCLIGRGGTADVWKMRDPAGHEVAVKVVRESDGLSSRAEWRVLRRYDHPNVVSVFHLLTDATGRSALVLEYCGGGTLEDVVVGRGGLTVGEVSSALAPIAGFVKQLHGDGIVHGDLSPQNILFTTDGSPRLADLGCVRAANLEGAQEWCTSGFAAPEVWDGDPPRAAADVYSLGALAWYALMGSPPEPPALRPRLADALPDVPDALAEAITSALSLTPSARLEIETLETALMTAAEPVAVPVSAVSATTPRAIMTHRRRKNAVDHQRHVHRPSGKHRSRTKHVRRGIWAGIGLGAAVTAGVLWPAPGNSPPDPVPASTRHGSAQEPTHPSKGAESARPSEAAPRRTVVPVALPQRQHIADLLQCRAAAWNTRDVQRLKRCLAPRSQALADDTKQLNAAVVAKVTFQGLNYTVQQVRSIVLEAGEPTARVVILQSKFVVNDSTGTRTQSAQEQTVRLTFEQVRGDWRIATWNVV